MTTPAPVSDNTERRSVAAALVESERFRRLVESFAQAVWETDAAGVVVADSPSWRAYTGQTFDEWLGDGWLAAIHPDDRADAERRWREAVASRREVDAQCRLKHVGGGWRWTNVRATPIVGADGSVLKWVGMNIDVHDRVLAEEALRAAHDTFRHLVEQSPFGVYAVDADFRLVQVSAGAQKVFENVRPLIGRDFADVLRIIWPEPFASEAIALFRHTLATGEPYHSPSTVERRRDSGDVESYDWKIERVMLPDGRPGVVCHFYDLSERQKYEAALRAADRQKDEFIAVLAHELRNPLAPIRTSVGILQSLGGTNPTLVRCRDIIDRQVTHMARLLDDLLDVARLSQGKLTLRREPLRLSDVLDAAIETARPAIEDKGHRFRCDTVDPAIIVDADATRLAQVFANLLNNAAKYTNPEGRIAVSVRADSSQVAVTVRDTGVGIDPVMRDRIFDLFTQLDGPGEHRDSGLGIGLGLARRLVEMHGGTIAVDSAGPEGGTAFTVALARHVSTDVEDQDRPRVEATAVQPRTGARPRVLVADDNADVTDTLAMLLESHGCEVRCVYDGESAVRESREFRPALVLLDLGMPGMSGDLACDRLRAESFGDEMIIVAVTGWGQADDRRRTRIAGFDHHFVKPVDPEALLKLLRNLAERG